MNIITPGLHGLPTDPCVQKMYEASRNFDTSHIVAPGYSQGEFGKYGSVEAHKKSLEEALALYCENRNIHLIGHSLGGLTSLICAGQFQDSIQGILLYNTSFGGKYNLEVSENKYPQSTEKWRKQGFQIRHDQSGEIYKLSWEKYWQEMSQYDAVKLSEKVRARCVLLTSTDDRIFHQEAFGAVKEILGKNNPIAHIEIEGPHVPKTEKDLQNLEKGLVKGLSFLHEK